MTAEETDLLDRIRIAGGPGRNQGSILPFYPSDDFLRTLTNEFRAEFASVFTMGINTHYLWVGTIDTIFLPIPKGGPNFEILIKHTHPRGTPSPSIHDIDWLRNSQNNGSPQLKSLILPIGRDRTSFNRITPLV